MNLKNKKLFIFDLDGTLVDTAPDFKNSLNYMLSELNEPLVTLEEIRNLVGYGARELIRRTVVTKNIPHDDDILYFSNGNNILPCTSDYT